MTLSALQPGGGLGRGRIPLRAGRVRVAPSHLPSRRRRPAALALSTLPYLRRSCGGAGERRIAGRLGRGPAAAAARAARHRGGGGDEAHDPLATAAATAPRRAPPRWRGVEAQVLEHVQQLLRVGARARVPRTLAAPRRAVRGAEVRHLCPVKHTHAPRARTPMPHAVPGTSVGAARTRRC
jgi:hypothetical protein